jgi:hypothetical protein
MYIIGRNTLSDNVVLKPQLSRTLKTSSLSIGS